MSDKIRVNNHSGRTHKNGQLFSAKHNDRDFDTKNAPHINQTKIEQNGYWQIYKGISFAENEERIYKELYQDGLDAKNGRYIQQRHPERVKSMADVMNSSQTAPDETLYYFGNKDNHIPAEDIAKIYVKFKEWHDLKFPQISIMDFALHLDEEGAPHIHERKTYWSKDKDGNKIPCQNQALKDMGIERPDTAKKQSKYNNPKITYSKICRTKLIELAREMGYDIESQPKESPHYSRDKEEFLDNQLAVKKEQIEHAKEQRLEALRERDTARAENGYERLLQEAAGASLRLRDNEYEFELIPEHTHPITKKTTPEHVKMPIETFKQIQTDISTMARLNAVFEALKSEERELRRTLVLKYQNEVDKAKTVELAKNEELAETLKSLKNDLKMANLSISSLKAEKRQIEANLDEIGHSYERLKSEVELIDEILQEEYGTSIANLLDNDFER